MALTFPYPLAFLSDVLRAGDVSFDMKRNDEMSGSGSGQFWAAELAPPLWQVTMSLAARRPEQAREIDAKIRALGIGRQTLLFTDPTYAPASRINPGGSASIGSISADRTRISLSGLLPDYVATIGDRISVSLGAGRYWTAELAEGAAANTSGVTPLVTVTPYLPLGINIGARVELIAPVLRCFVPPSGHKPFGMTPGRIALGASLTLLQKV